jgi:hypothetical protein
VTANNALVLFLAVFWGGLATVVKITNLLAGKRWSDGPSLIPVIPLHPLAAGMVGWLVNLVVSPWGSWLICALHVGWIVVAAIVGELRHQRSRPTDDA